MGGRRRCGRGLEVVRPGNRNGRALRLDQAAELVARDFLGEEAGVAGLCGAFLGRAVLLVGPIDRHQHHHNQKHTHQAADDEHRHVVDAANAGVIRHFARRCVG